MPGSRALLATPAQDNDHAPPPCLAQPTHLTYRGPGKLLSLVRSWSGRTLGEPAREDAHYPLGIREAVKGQGKPGYFKRRVVGGARKITFISVSQQGPLDE